MSRFFVSFDKLGRHHGKIFSGSKQNSGFNVINGYGFKSSFFEFSDKSDEIYDDIPSFPEK